MARHKQTPRHKPIIEIKMADTKLTSSDWRQVACNPLVFQGFRPPFTVPPEQVSTWTDKDERDYKFWLGIGSKDTRDDYRQFLLSLNMEYNMDEVFNRIDVGLEAFEKLVACMREFPKYNLSKDIDKMYPKDSAVFKDFIKCGVDFVTAYPYENESDCESEPENDNHGQSDNTGLKAEEVFEEKPRDEFVTPVKENKSRKKNKRNKEKRKDRLLKFHQKLVLVSGLPPSRLMLQQTPKPGRDLGSLKRRKLDFEVDEENPDLMPVKEEATSPKPTVKQPESVTPHETCGTGATSNYNYNPMLCSSSATQVHCPGGYGMTGNTQWSEARPWCEVTPGYSNHLQQSPTGISSNISQTLMLCSCPQCCGRWVGVSQPPPSPVPPPQPPPHAGNPAFCGSCLLFGNVYTLTPV